MKSVNDGIRPWNLEQGPRYRLYGQMLAAPASMVRSDTEKGRRNLNSVLQWLRDLKLIGIDEAYTLMEGECVNGY